jgi:hypothetical protein
MTTDQIISKELPKSFRRALDDYELRESDTHEATNAALLTEFQQAQLDAINRFVEATQEKARKTYDEFGSHYDEEFIRAVNEIKHQLNEQAKR